MAEERGQAYQAASQAVQNLQDEVEVQRNTLTEQLEEQLEQRVQEQVLFNVKWMLQ